MVFFAGNIAEWKFSPKVFRSRYSRSDYENARFLLKRIILSDEELKAYLDHLYFRTKEILSFPSVWMLVEAVAKRLSSRKTLTGKGVSDVIEAKKLALWRQQRTRAIRMQNRRHRATSK